MKDFKTLYEQAETHDDYWIAGAVHEFTEEIVKLMQHSGVTRSELARRLGTSPAYVTKILRGNTNFTLASMVRLARALEAELRVELTTEEPVERDRSRRPASDQGIGKARRRTKSSQTARLSPSLAQATL